MDCDVMVGTFDITIYIFRRLSDWKKGIEGGKLEFQSQLSFPNDHNFWDCSRIKPVASESICVSDVENGSVGTWMDAVALEAGLQAADKLTAVRQLFPQHDHLQSHSSLINVEILNLC